MRRIEFIRNVFRFNVDRKTGSGRWLIWCAIALVSSGVLHGQDRLRSIPDPDPEHQLSTLYPAEGFEVNLFASEPMVVKPIQMNWDERGRLWVVGSSQYPQPLPGAEPNGKIFILEDTDGDGRADTSILFADGLQVPTAILPGDGGVYVANSTEVLHLKDTDGDGKADQRKVILSGFGTGDTHHLLHTFRWGPDGSLYFNQSIYIYSHVETPHGVRRLEGGGVWRYRPATQELEVYIRGLVNPWGLQFNQYGQSFLTDGAGSEGIHYGFQGATFMTAPGAHRILRGLNPGQPKHSGLDIITGRHMPREWQGSMITNDFRANRINRFTLEKAGSGYTSKQEADLLYSNNVAFRPVDILEGPDGAIYVADWYNPIIQHGEVDFRDPRRDQEHGRIWRITRKDSPLVSIPDLADATNLELLDFLKLPEAWTRDQARRLLKERGKNAVIGDLVKWISELDPQGTDYDMLLLEGFKVYQSVDAAAEEVLKRLLSSDDALIRAAAVRSLYFQRLLYPSADDYLTKAVEDPDPVVRLEAVIALQQSEWPRAAEVAARVLNHEVDEYIDYALWQTIRILEPVWWKAYEAERDHFDGVKKKAFALKSVTRPDAVADLVAMYREGALPEEYHKDFLDNIARYSDTPTLSEIFELLFTPGSDQNALLRALIRTREQRDLKPDIRLEKIEQLFDSENATVSGNAILAAGHWKLSQFRPRFEEWVASDSEEKISIGLEALALLGDKPSQEALASFSASPYSTDLRLAAIAKLIALDARTAALQATALLQDLQKDDKISGLLSGFFANQHGARELAQALTDQEIPEQVSRQGMKMINSMSQQRKDSEEVKALISAFGRVEIEADKPTMPQELSAWETDRLELDIKAYGDPVKGELVYRKLGCAACHAIGGAGGKLGTDLSSLGANAPTDYIISSILDPGREIKDGYELNQIIRTNGNVVMGYLVRETEEEVVLRDVVGNEVSVPRHQISSHENVPGSLMPPGLTSGLTRDEFVDLIGFLSKIGEPGDFRVPAYKYVRYWEGLQVNKEVASKIGSEGEDVLATEAGAFSWMPMYSKVSGDIPLSEFEHDFKALKFAIDVHVGGKIRLKFEAGVVDKMWVDGSRQAIGSGGIELNLEPGIRECVLLFRPGMDDGDFIVEVVEESTGSGRADPLHHAAP